MKNILISIIAVFMTLGCSSNEYEEAAWNVVKKFNNNTTVHIPADTRSAFPVISVHSPVSIQCRWQS